MKVWTADEIGRLLKVVTAMEMARQAELHRALGEESRINDEIRHLTAQASAPMVEAPIGTREAWTQWLGERRHVLNGALARARVHREKAGAACAQVSAKRQVLERLHREAVGRQRADRETRRQDEILRDALLRHAAGH